MSVKIIKVDENVISFDQAKLDALVTKSGKSQKEFVEDTYGMKEGPQYDVKGAGVFDFARSVYGSDKFKVNRFFQDVGAWSKSADSVMKVLTPDKDGTSYIMPKNESEVGKTLTPPAAGTTVSSKKTVAAKDSKQIPGCEVKIGKDVLKVSNTLLGEDNVSFKVDNDKDNMSYEFTVLRTYYVAGGLDAINKQIIEHLGKLFKEVMMDGQEMKFKTSPESFKIKVNRDEFAKGNIVYELTCSDNRIPMISIPLDTFTGSKVAIVAALKDELKKIAPTVDSDGVTISDNKVSIIRKGASSGKMQINNMVAEYIDKEFFSSAGVVVDAGLVLNSLSQITSVRFTITMFKADQTTMTTNEALMEIKRLADKMVTVNKALVNTGVDDMGNPYCTYEVSDKGFIEKMVKATKLDETFGYGFCADAINEDIIDARSTEAVENWLLRTKYKGIMDAVESLECEYNPHKNIYDCYFILKEGYEVPDNFPLTVVEDEDNNMLLAYDEISKTREVESIKEEYSRARQGFLDIKG